MCGDAGEPSVCRTLLRTRALAIVLAFSAGLGACGDEAPVAPQARDLDVERTFEVPSNKHVTGHVAYSQTPPVGGDHAADVQRCGFYPGTIPSERGVHSMEHGAVWITYDPSLSKRDVEALRVISQGQKRVLISRWDKSLPASIVASAWGRQMNIASVADPHLVEFVNTYSAGTQAPEPGAFC